MSVGLVGVADNGMSVEIEEIRSLVCMTIHTRLFRLTILIRIRQKTCCSQANVSAESSPHQVYGLTGWMSIGVSLPDSVCFAQSRKVLRALDDLTAVVQCEERICFDASLVWSS